MPNAPASVAGVLQSSGASALVILFELQTISGTRAYYASAPVTAQSLLSQYDLNGVTSAAFLARILEPPAFTFTGTTATATARMTIDNLPGNTIERDGSKVFSANELWGAMYVYRLWQPETEYALLHVVGTIADASDDGDTLDLSLTDIGNWGEIAAPEASVSTNCQLVFGSQQCGSTSATPCTNTRGTCSQLNRFKGVVTVWDSQLTLLPNGGLAQPAPAISYNSRRAS
jgi:hypothetical protein